MQQQTTFQIIFNKILNFKLIQIFVLIHTNYMYIHTISLKNIIKRGSDGTVGAN